MRESKHSTDDGHRGHASKPWYRPKAPVVKTGLGLNIAYIHGALTHAPSHLTERATHAHPLHPAARVHRRRSFTNLQSCQAEPPRNKPASLISARSPSPGQSHLHAEFFPRMPRTFIITPASNFTGWLNTFPGRARSITAARRVPSAPATGRGATPKNSEHLQCTLVAEFNKISRYEQGAFRTAWPTANLIDGSLGVQLARKLRTAGEVSANAGGDERRKEAL